MTSPATLNIQDVWNRFLQEVKLARNYHLPYQLVTNSVTFHNPLLEAILPSLLYVKLAAILDEALKDFIVDRSLNFPKKYGDSLNGRIEFLNDQSQIANYHSLHQIRDLRNLLAHKVTQTTSWDQLNADIDLIEDELQHFGFVGQRPDYQYFGKCSAMRGSDDPDVISERDYRFGIECGDQTILEFSTTEKLFK